MRKKYQAILKKCFSNDLIQTRAALGLTQSQMAERLAMSDRSYIDLDHGIAVCGGVTLVVYLCNICLDPMGFLWKFRDEAKREGAGQDPDSLPVRGNDAVSYRKSVTVKERYIFSNCDSYPVCPRCHVSLDREYVSYCDRCGQHLDWSDYDEAVIRKTPRC